MRCLSTAVILLTCAHVALGVINIKVGVLLMADSLWPFDLPVMGPAISIGVETALSVYGVNMQLVYHPYGPNCPLEAPIGHLVELKQNHNIDAVIGPSCSQSIVGAGRLAEYYNIPLLTGLGDLVIRNPENDDMYETTTVLSYSIVKLSNSLTAILRHYHWKHTAIIFDYTHTLFSLAGSSLAKDLRDSTYTENPLELTFDISRATEATYKALLKEAATRARVFIIFTSATNFREIMYYAHTLGYSNGEFVFITLELYPSAWLGFYQQFVKGDSWDAGVTKIYQSVLLLTLRKLDNQEYFAFSDKVRDRALQDYNETIDHPASYFVTAFHDAVMYLAEAYNETQAEGGNITDGKAIAQKFWNGSFLGVTGPVGVSAIGDRIADFDLLDMKSPATKEFQIAGRFRGATGQYSPTDGVEVWWPKGLPPDVPACGFVGELCIPSKVDYTVIIVVVLVMSVILIVAAIGAFLVYRKFKAEQEIDKKTWLVQPDEIQSRKGKFNDSFMSKSYLHMGQDGGKPEDSQVYCKTGYCRHQVVAQRKLHLDEVEITRELSVQCRQMQLINNANVATFVGICFEPMNNILLMEYCPRGSLQDMVNNENIELDWDFRFSLIHDIIKGMEYIHSSPLHLHGHLSSPNCVIDSRFSLKITDYGPQEILKRDRIEECTQGTEDGSYNQRKLLWIAPEHLATSPSGCSTVSQKGDVYSFGIILQEIITRTDPFEANGIDVDQLIKQLISRKPEIVRPEVSDEAASPELLEMMRSCWHDTPEERPSFLDLEEVYKKMRRGKKTNIMDNLLDRMSDYADNLEQLAAERTKAFLEEKQKVEELLHRLLPETIARQLQIGQKVVPENFDCVSIYFSDVVGFTTICGKSTPIQVVDLLNDLYTLFDSAIDQFKVYKVETIGDAYMCVSGLPERIGDRHAVEICNMSLILLHSVQGFTIRHMPTEHINIRIGLHSGPVVAGVVGLTMPRYCLFGDTVNTASRMESNSAPLRIHMSNTTKELLEKYPNYNIEPRGSIEVKGKGTMETFWLNPYTDSHGRVFPGQPLDKSYNTSIV